MICNMKHQKHWTDALITDSILRVIDERKLDRMPSLAEIESYYGDKRVSSAIGRNGGRAYFAKILNINIVNGNTKLKKRNDPAKETHMIYYVFCRRSEKEPWSEWGTSKKLQKALELEQFAIESDLETRLVTNETEAHKLKRKAFAFFNK